MNEQWIWPCSSGITDLSSTDADLASAQLASARILWLQRREQLSEESLRTFSAKLDRRFAIESSVIERVFRLDRGITEVLVEEGVKASLIPHGASDKPTQYVMDILESALAAQEWMQDRFIRDKNPVTTFSIKELHQLLTRAQLTTEAVTPTGERIEVPLLHGEWKKTDNQVRKDDSVLRYCPPEQTASEMERLVEMHSKHLRSDVAPEIAAAWVHHRFVQIHPFQDGNGRVARCLASLVFIKQGLFPVIVTRDETATYIDALESADGGNLKPLVSYFVKGQLHRFDQALNLVDSVLEPSSTRTSAISSIADTIKRRDEERLASLRAVLVMADKVVKLAEQEMEATARELQSVGLDAFATASRKDDDDFFYGGQAIGYAKEHGYFADTGTYRAWARLKFETRPITQLLLHFHSRGRDFLGVIVCAPIFEVIEFAGNEGPAHREALEIAPEPFDFYSTETIAQVTARFKVWLDEVLALALSQAQRFL